MNILILGGGGREHAFAYKIAQSLKCQKLFVAPGNAGTEAIAENVSLDPNAFQDVKKFVLEKNIKLVIVGPEEPLVYGIYDFFQMDKDLMDVKLVGPSQAGAELEGSKKKAKEFMSAHGIPTARYKSFTADNIQEGKSFLKQMKAPYVLKADGLAAGKGVLILDDIEEAKKELEEILLGNKFGKAGAKVVVEEFLDGIELSVFILTDGKDYLILPTAKDYKRIGEGDSGLNTGGMGAVSPVPFADPGFMEKVEERIIRPTVEGLKKEHISYYGFIFIGLIKVEDEPYVIEYNVRMGDPETEVVIPRIKNDLVEVFEVMFDHGLRDYKLEISEKTAATVMAVSGGYPQSYGKGKAIQGLSEIKDSLVFHAGTVRKGDKILTSGGRVLAVTSFGENFTQALDQSYKSLQKLSFEKMYYRKDIGFDLS